MYVCPVTSWFKIGKAPLPTILSQLCWKMEPVTKEISSSYLKVILRAPSRHFDCILNSFILLIWFCNISSPLLIVPSVLRGCQIYAVIL